MNIVVELCWVVYEPNSIENSIRLDDWTAEYVIIASNVWDIETCLTTSRLNSANSSEDTDPE